MPNPKEFTYDGRRFKLTYLDDGRLDRVYVSIGGAWVFCPINEEAQGIEVEEVKYKRYPIRVLRQAAGETIP